MATPIRYSALLSVENLTIGFFQTVAAEAAIQHLRQTGLCLCGCTGSRTMSNDKAGPKPSKSAARQGRME